MIVKNIIRTFCLCAVLLLPLASCIKEEPPQPEPEPVPVPVPVPEPEPEPEKVWTLDVKVMPLSKAYARNSVNTSVFRVNSICSDDKYQIASYFDDQGYVTFAKRSLGSDEWTIVRSDYKCNCGDAHNSISVALDGDGYVHLVYDQHGTQLKYRKSNTPYSFDFGDILVMIGSSEGRVTYPEFHRRDNGNLLFLYRDGVSGNGGCVVNEYVTATKTWRRVQDLLLDGEGKRNAYWQSCYSGDIFYLSWVWRESGDVATNHDMCYAYSKDGGQTWLDSKSEKCQIPINQNTSDIVLPIPQKSELINQTSMAVDNQGNPYIATYWRDQNDEVPQYKMVRKIGDKWEAVNVSARKTPFSLSGIGTKRIPVARPKLVVDKENRGFYLFRDIERDEVASLFWCENILEPEWKTVDLTDFTVGAWEPTVDESRWETDNVLDIYVQNSFQGDGEVSVDAEGQMAYVIEVKMVESDQP